MLLRLGIVLQKRAELNPRLSKVRKLLPGVFTDFYSDEPLPEFLVEALDLPDDWKGKSFDQLGADAEALFQTRMANQLASLNLATAETRERQAAFIAMLKSETERLLDSALRQENMLQALETYVATDPNRTGHFVEDEYGRAHPVEVLGQATIMLNGVSTRVALLEAPDVHRAAASGRPVGKTRVSFI